MQKLSRTLLTASPTGGLGAYRVGHGAVVALGGRLRTADPGHRRGTERTGGGAPPSGPTLADGWGAGLSRRAAPGAGGGVSAAAVGASGPHAAAPAGRAADPG